MLFLASLLLALSLNNDVEVTTLPDFIVIHIMVTTKDDITGEVDFSEVIKVVSRQQFIKEYGPITLDDVKNFLDNKGKIIIRIRLEKCLI